MYWALGHHHYCDDQGLYCYDNVYDHYNDDTDDAVKRLTGQKVHNNKLT